MTMTTNKKLLGFTAGLLASTLGGAQSIEKAMARNAKAAKDAKATWHGRFQARNQAANVARTIKKEIGARQFKKLQRQARRAAE